MNPVSEDQTSNNCSATTPESLKTFNKEEHFTKATGTTQYIGGTGSYHNVGKGPQNNIGSYGINNGILCFVDEHADYWIGRETNEAYLALQDAGYLERGINNIPHSNDGGGWFVKNFDSPRGLTPEAIEAKRIQAQVKATLELLKPFDKHRYFRKATRTNEYVGGTGSYKIVGIGHPTEIGHYSSNNGILCFVDENRDYWVGLETVVAEIALQEAGYEARGVNYIPHSNDGGGWVIRNCPRIS